MSLPVLIMGRSGSGKTYSIRNFKPDEVGVISVEKGRLPFKSDIKAVKVPPFTKGEDGKPKLPPETAVLKYFWIKNAIKVSKAKSVVIDDSQYLLVNELFDRAKKKG